MADQTYSGHESQTKSEVRFKAISVARLFQYTFTKTDLDISLINKSNTNTNNLLHSCCTLQLFSIIGYR